MHPQLSDKKLVCKEFIQALEQCHAAGWNRFVGSCNKQKDELNHCLRSERLDRTAQNREQAKERKQKTDQALQEFRAL
ncbi:hypothetical protein GALMADRAFT_227914 [Galerina marginata CBS 339.88]|uniref:COX assembly mitochondrial protein n=1 Tax=Galerina marginata (strain CBS 339.88) TaxID=685588 RepID=A0A067SRJ2_GALM3|nr:hypothetical protein GALMADRAFT_227914 [Galerina marginata CBS 339.88]